MAKIKVPLKLLADALTILPLRRLAPFPRQKKRASDADAGEGALR